MDSNRAASQLVMGKGVLMRSRTEEIGSLNCVPRNLIVEYVLLRVC